MNDLTLIEKLFRHATHPVIFTDSSGEILFANEVLHGANSIVFNQQNIELSSFIKIYTADLKTDPSASTEATVNLKQFLFTAAEADGHFLISGADITHLTQEKNFYKESLDNLPADIGVFDTEGRYLYVNPAGIKDVNLRNWIIGKTDFDYCIYRGRDTSMAEDRKKLIKKIVETKTEHGFEEEIKRQGKETDWQLRKLSPVFDKEGNIKFLLAYGINIKDRKLAEIAQKEALAIVERSAKAKEDFVAVMSHEIRTPMNAIIGMSRLLAKTSLDEKQSAYLDAVLTASGNLIVIVNDILDFSKIEAGKLRLEYSGFSFNEVLEYVKAVTAHQAAEKDLQLEFHLDKSVSSIFIGDIYRINQVVVNLVNNAIKFTHKGKVTVNIELEKDGEHQQELCIWVKDTGIGMTDSFMEEMFIMYSQETGITRKYGGTGLGLKITSQLVELMNGHIEVESKKNEGSCIKVRLSLTKGDVKDMPQANHLHFPEDSLIGKNILIAEDNSLNSLVASTVLQNYGATVVNATNGEEAIEALKAHKNIHAVLMDVEMPVMDGIEATSIIRKELCFTLPVIALTANVMPEDKEKLSAAGMDGFISKPFAEADLIGTLLKNLR